MMVAKLLVSETLVPVSGFDSGYQTARSGLKDMSVIQAWHWALLQGKTVDASALRRIIDEFDEEPTSDDAEWQ